MGWQKPVRNAVAEAEAVTNLSVVEEAHQVPASLSVTRRQAMTPACDVVVREEAVAKAVVSVPGKEEVEDRVTGFQLTHQLHPRQ